MSKKSELVSPKQVARAIGVSESSLKRWCDQGRIRSIRTVGGHRKLPIAEVLRFIREQDQPLGSPELLSLPPSSGNSVPTLARNSTRLVDSLLAGDETVARQIVFDLYLTNHPLSIIFDEVITAAFREIGDRWARHDVDVYQERCSCEITLRTLCDLRRVQTAREDQGLALGATIEGDLYSLPTAMVELVLRERGFRARSLGTSIPFASLNRAVRVSQPKLFWLSVSHIREGLDFVSEFEALASACAAAGTALVVGGRALTEDVRQRLSYSAYCDNMRHLEGFVRAISRSSTDDQHPASRVSSGRSKEKLDKRSESSS